MSCSSCIAVDVVKPRLNKRCLPDCDFDVRGRELRGKNVEEKVRGEE